MLVWCCHVRPLCVLSATNRDAMSNADYRVVGTVDSYSIVHIYTKLKDGLQLGTQEIRFGRKRLKSRNLAFWMKNEIHNFVQNLDEKWPTNHGKNCVILSH